MSRTANRAASGQDLETHSYVRLSVDEEIGERLGRFGIDGPMIHPAPTDHGPPRSVVAHVRDGLGATSSAEHPAAIPC